MRRKLSVNYQLDGVTTAEGDESPADESMKNIVFLDMHKTARSDIVAQFYQSRFGRCFFPGTRS